MDIAVLGAGAMGTLFGAHLAARHNVLMVDVSEQRVRRLQEQGARICSAEGELARPLRAVTSAAERKPVDLVLVFVKAMHTAAALAQNRALIGPQTYLMTLQNGAGHEEILGEFAPAGRVILGTTQHNASFLPDGRVHHGGGGETWIGLLTGETAALEPIAAAFTASGLHTAVMDDVRRCIWQKLLLNTSASALTAILQMPLGYILDNPDARALMQTLVREAVAVANRQVRMPLDAQEEILRIESALHGARQGYTSICMDIRAGRQTEVDTISGYVLAMADRLGVSTPCHRTVVALLHALQSRPAHSC